MKAVPVEAMQAIVEFLRDLLPSGDLEADDPPSLNAAPPSLIGGSGKHRTNARHSSVSAIILSAIGKSEVSSDEETIMASAAAAPPPPKETEPVEVASSSAKKPSGKIADLQARLNLNPAMFMGSMQAPKALALKNKRGLTAVSEEPSKAAAPDKPSTSTSTSTTTKVDAAVPGPTAIEPMAHANLARPAVNRGRRPRRVPVEATPAVSTSDPARIQ